MPNKFIESKIISIFNGFYIRGTVHNFNKLQILIDIGAEISVINNSLVQNCLIIPDNSINIVAVNDMPINRLGSIKIPIKIDAFSVNYLFFVVQNLPYECVLGVDFCTFYGISIDFPNRLLYIPKQKSIKRKSDCHSKNQFLSSPNKRLRPM